MGRDVVFSAGQYEPGSNAGRKLLSHELTHVVQQANGQGTLLQRQLRSAPAAQQVIGLGSSGAAVEELQHRLNQAGAAPLLDADGIFGQRTRSALIAFQQSHGLVADGIAGPLTWAALGGTPPGPSEAPGTVATTGAFEQATMMESTSQETPRRARRAGLTWRHAIGSAESVMTAAENSTLGRGRRTISRIAKGNAMVRISDAGTMAPSPSSARHNRKSIERP